MAATRRRPAIIIAGLLIGLLAVNLQDVLGEELEKVPSEDQCRPYIEKALKDLGTEGSEEVLLSPDATADTTIGGVGGDDDDDATTGEDVLSADAIDLDDGESISREKRSLSDEETKSINDQVDQAEEETVEVTSVEDENDQEIDSKEEADEEMTGESTEDEQQQQQQQQQQQEQRAHEVADDATHEEEHDQAASTDDDEGEGQKEDDSEEASGEEEADDNGANNDANEPSEEATFKEGGDDGHEDDDKDKKNEIPDESVQDDSAAKEELAADQDDNQKSMEEEEEEEETIVAEEAISREKSLENLANVQSELENDAPALADENHDHHDKDGKSQGIAEKSSSKSREEDEEKRREEDGGGEEEEEEEEEGEESASPEEEELIMEIEVPEILRPRDHIGQLLKLDEENEGKEKAVEKIADVVLRDLKRLYDNAIKPLETLYKYRDLSNRHFGDPEIFSKPLVLFMGPWSGGKSSIINYLLDMEYKPTSLRTGAEPSPAYFNILMHGAEEEVLDGTQLAADWTFSGLQKFGQGLLDRLKGYKLKSKLLEKVNIVEIPGILEIRKQVQRLFPFNDACQWFIDRADIIFLVYDPSKLDVGPETEAILDQLKGREYQTRIILNKADQVKPEELMRVQGALIWNISPLMSSAEPPIMYSTSLWSIPYEAGAPTRLLYAQERAFLRDLRSAIDKRVEHKIASARRFAVRVRNHAKMVDCYLTTYYNHKSFFAKKKDVADRIIESPQDYHIYEGLSTLTNISRYDLPDPDVYRDFFRLNNLYEFPLLSSTCTYFRGCPINRLDVAIAYDLPELVGKYKKSAEAATLQVEETLAAAAEAPPQAAAAAAAQAPQKAKSDASKLSLS